jgi:hypothetical protein
VSVPAGQTSFSARVDARATLGVLVDVTGQFNLQTGLISWTFTALDPLTLDLPADPRAGFLPPNVVPPQGTGFVTYTVEPKSNLVTGTKINAQATVVFDTNAPINTPQMYDTVDAGSPTSAVTALPATTTTAAFAVHWAGTDDVGGSGVADYNVYVSDNGGPFALWQTATTATSAVYTGQNGHTYGFYSVATDNVGNVQSTPTAAQATTSLAVAPTHVQSVQVNDGSAQRSEVRSMTVTFSDAVTFTGGNAAAAFQLKHVQTGNNVILSAAIAVSATGATVVTLAFAGAETDPVSALHGAAASLSDGRYQLTIPAGAVTGGNGLALDGDADGTSGGDYVSPADAFHGTGLHLYRLYGDVSGDGVVDATDLGQFRSTFNANTSQPNYLAFLDADNSGAVDAQDLSQFRTRFNANVFGVPVVAAPPAVAAVVVNDGEDQRSEVRSITVTFSGPVRFAGGPAAAGSAFRLVNLADGNPVALAAMAFTDDRGRTAVMLTFAGAETDPVSGLNGGRPSLADGRYQLTILGSAVTGTNGLALDGDANGSAGGNYVSPADTYHGAGLHLYRLFGDATGDGAVDALDLGFLRSALNSGGDSPVYLSYLDSDNSGTLDYADLGQFRKRFNRSVV